MTRVAVRNYKSALSGGSSIVGTSSLLNVGNGNGMSCAFWYYPTAVASGQTIIGFQTSAAGDSFRITAEVNTSKLFTWHVNSAGSGSIGIKQASAPPLKEWHRVVFTFDGTNTSRIYVNGVLQGSGGTALPRDTERMAIFPSNNTAEYLNDVRVWNREITQTEVNADYYSGTMPANNVLWWRLDEGAGDTVNDASGNAITATITSPTWTSNVPTTLRKEVNGNLVKNGDFEYAPPFTAAQTTSTKWLDGTAAGSSTNNLFGQFAKFSGTSSAQFDTSVSYTGTVSLKLSTLAAGSYVEIVDFPTFGTPTEAMVRQYGIPALPSTSYTLTYWMKTNYVSGLATSGAAISAIELDSDGGAAVASTTGTYVKTTTDWTKYSVVFTTDATTRFLSIRKQIYGHSGGTADLIMDAWFDDIVLTPTTATTRTAVTGLGRQPVGNLVKNGDFRYTPAFTAATTGDLKWIDGTAAGSATNDVFGWGLNNSSGTGASANFDNTVTFNGKPTMKLETTEVASFAEVTTFADLSVAQQRRYAIPCLPNTSYTMTFWMKTEYVSGDATTGTFASLVTMPGDATTTGGASISGVKTTTDWTFYTITHTTASDRTFIRPRLNLYGHNGTATLIMKAWFADVQIYPSSGLARTAV